MRPLPAGGSAPRMSGGFFSLRCSDPMKRELLGEAARGAFFYLCVSRRENKFCSKTRKENKQGEDFTPLNVIFVCSPMETERR